MASGTAEVANPLLAFVFQIRVVHERRIGIGGRLLLFQGDQIAGDVFGVLRSEAQAGHYSHVLDLELMAVVRTLAVLQVENKWQPLLLLIFGTDVLFFVRTLGAAAVSAGFRPTE